MYRWRKLYLAALFEADRLRLPSRIDEAERALISRARELFAHCAHNSDEAKAIEKGLYAIRALHICLRLAADESSA